jgi:hypothetical protein
MSYKPRLEVCQNQTRTACTGRAFVWVSLQMAVLFGGYALLTHPRSESKIRVNPKNRRRRGSTRSGRVRLILARRTGGL